MASGEGSRLKLRHRRGFSKNRDAYFFYSMHGVQPSDVIFVDEIK